MIKLILILSFCLSMTSCGSKPTARTITQVAPQATPSEQVASGKTVGNVKNDMFEACINPDGSVTLKFNEQLCQRFADTMTMPCRIGQGYKYGVEGLKATCKDLILGNFGNDVHPMLVMLTTDGRVALLNLIDAIATGDMQCSGPLHGLENVVAIKEVTDEDGTIVVAVMPNGIEEMVNENRENVGYFTLGTFEMHLTDDWNISMNDEVVGYHRYGTYYQDLSKVADGPGEGVREYIADIDGSLLRIVIHEYNREKRSQYRVTFYADDDFPLEQGKPLKMTRTPYTKLAD